MLYFSMELVEADMGDVSQENMEEAPNERFYQFDTCRMGCIRKGRRGVLCPRNKEVLYRELKLTYTYKLAL